MSTSYKGRFAPSATGHLHLGSLLTAFACALEAKSQEGTWIVRIDDIDISRCSESSIQSIKNSVELFFCNAPPADIVQQTDRQEKYNQVLNQLVERSLVYQCHCNRKTVQAMSARGAIASYHPCRETPCSYFDKSAGTTYRFLNPFNPKGYVERDLTLFRRDGCYAYHLACVVDDELDRVTHIIRGEDLLGAEIPQRKLIEALHYSQPYYSYLPLVRDETGRKLSKQNHATPIFDQLEQNSRHALSLFRWPTSGAQIHELPLPQLWQWAMDHWDLSINQIPQHAKALSSLE